jgi:hypothetical protein
MRGLLNNKNRFLHHRISKSTKAGPRSPVSEPIRCVYEPQGFQLANSEASYMKSLTLATIRPGEKRLFSALSDAMSVQGRARAYQRPLEWLSHSVVSSLPLGCAKAPDFPVTDSPLVGDPADPAVVDECPESVP